VDKIRRKRRAKSAKRLRGAYRPTAGVAAANEDENDSQTQTIADTRRANANDVGVGFAARGGVGFGVGYRKRRRYGRLQQLRNDNHTHADFEYPILGFGIYQKGEDGDPRLYWFKWFDGSTTDS
jgi:hypothetical protein